MSFTQSTPTIAQMGAGDKINFNGKTQSIVSVGTYVNDGGGRGHRTATLDDANSTVITVSTKDTILSSNGYNGSTAQQVVWSQSVDA